MKKSSLTSGSIQTRLAHAGLVTDKLTGAVSTPIYQTATFAHPGVGQSTGFDYSRTSNPTRLVLEKVLADLEQGAAASTFASGMAAISALQCLFKPGDTLLVSDDLYGGTYRLFEQVFKPWDLRVVFCDFSDLAAVRRAIDQSVVGFFIETPSNPLMKIVDLKKAIALARERNLLVIVDNTFMTPYCQRPLELGADIVVHSGTKFLAGHNDTLFGALISRSAELAQKIAFIQNATGGVASPFDSWLALRGIKTLALRVNQSQQNALAIADWLCAHKKVSRVFFPGLTTHTGHRIHLKQTTGPGSVISFTLKSARSVQRTIDRVRTITYAESLGGVESLITYPILQTHADIPASVRQRIGITDTLVRLSVGIESSKDLISDLEQAIG